MEKIEYVVPETASYSQAKVQLEAKITSLTELGLTLRTQVEIPEGLALEVVSDLFKRMDLKAPPTRIISCHKLVEFDYEIQVAFVGANESLQNKIRAWIHAQPKRKKEAA